MAKFPVYAPIGKVIKAFESLGFRLVREGNHVAMARENPDGTRTLLTMPNHRRIIGSDALGPVAPGHRALMEGLVGSEAELVGQVRLTEQDEDDEGSRVHSSAKSSSI